MYKKNTSTGRLTGPPDGGVSNEYSPYVEIDPSGRYGRLREVLGKGAMKTVYRAFDEALGMEVAWNQVKLNEVFRSPETLQRLYSEVHLLKTLDHDSIIRYSASWIDVARRTFNFITEMFTSGTLREYRRKYRKIDIRAIKRWARQILKGLVYLHGHDPPVIHRDLKCDNIFVNGHLGQVKIGDLGLAAILRGSQYAHSVIGTPEFMAPELYEEEYDKLVDVYSFGMCVLEMLTGEYPYSECSNPAQIYKKVTSGKLPEAFYRVENEEARGFIGKCLETVSKRLSAKQLLLDPFLAEADENDSASVCRGLQQLAIQNLTPNAMVDDPLTSSSLDPSRITDMSITGTMNPDDSTIFLQVQISDENISGKMRNIHFPFDVVNDTAVQVALEMVKELEICDWDPLEIAEMIEQEISSLVPNWRRQDHTSYIHRTRYGYDDNDDDDDHLDDDDENTHRFCAISSCSSSQDSLVAASKLHLIVTRDSNTCFNHDLLQDHENGSSGSSSNPSFNDEEGDECNDNSSRECRPHSRESGDSSAKPHTSTRFCPENGGEDQNKHHRRRRRLQKIRSLVDMRTQVLHRSLMDLINKRRGLKTVGPLQNRNEHLGPNAFIAGVSRRSSKGK